MSLSAEILQDGYTGDLTTLRLLQLLCRMSNDEAADYCGVSPETYRRWRNDRKPTTAAVRLLAVRAGYFPWPEWQGWECHNGRLFPPGFQRHGISPGEVMAIPYLHAQIAELSRLVRELRSCSDGVQLKARAV